MRKLFWLGGMLMMYSAYAELKVPEIFSENMVLQRNIPAPIWGVANPGERVTVKFKSQEKSVTAGTDGKWMIRLEPMKASPEPCELIVSSPTSNQQLEIKNVLVGEVWICSGQSNMQSSFDYLKITQEVEGVNYSLIRLNSGNKWATCTTQDLQRFSCVGYYFGLNLWKELQIPIGLINISCGCSSIEAWMTPESLSANDLLIDMNGCNLFSEMKKFQQFHSNYKQCSDEEKERVFLEHCQGKYTFARGYLQNGKPMLDKYDSILWHMTVVKPAFLHNSRIVPVIPFGVKGVIWYQGETNIFDKQYALKQRILIEGWRKLWGEGDFPFYIVQLAPCKDGRDSPLPDFWVQQYEAVRKTSNTGLISAVDIGDSNEYHPKNKRDVGLRLALLALRDTYGRKEIVASGPTYKSVKIADGKMIVSFDNTGSGLTTKDGKSPNWFEIAGVDGQFVPAQTSIQGDTVEVSNPETPKPEYVRYGWSSIADPNLRNKEGLGAFPFNTAESFFKQKSMD